MATQNDQAVMRSAAYDALSLAFLYPEAGMAATLAAKLRHLGAGARAMPWPETADAAEAAAAALDESCGEYMEEAFLALFGHAVPADCPPYETEYDQAHIFQKSQTLADVVAFYSAFGVGPDPRLKDRPDHLSVEMSFMQLLTLKEFYALAQGHGSDAVAVCRQGQEGFLAQHLAPWIPVFVQRIQRKAGPDNPYLALVRLLAVFMEQEWAAFGQAPALSLATVSAGAREESLTTLAPNYRTKE